jgi:CRISPR/Cas system type I-B associated protein Csh2 (Cas7 group RAMP superfamily)
MVSRSRNERARRAVHAQLRGRVVSDTGAPNAQTLGMACFAAGGGVVRCGEWTETRIIGPIALHHARSLDPVVLHRAQHFAAYLSISAAISATTRSLRRMRVWNSY